MSNPSSNPVDKLLSSTAAQAAGASPAPPPPPSPTAKRPQTRGRQEGFVIEPAEVIAMIGRAIADVEQTAPERRNPRHALELLLGFSFGLRVTDFVDLTWDQVLNHEVFTLHEVKLRGRKVSSGRRRPRRREVRVPAQVAAKAQHLYDLTLPENRHAKYVFGKVHARGAARTMADSRSENPERWSSRAMCTDFRRACERYGTPGVSDSAYYSCCRPTYGRWRFEIIQEETGSFDMAVAAVQAEFNHATPEMTKRYLKLGMKDERTRAAVNERFMNFELEEQPKLTRMGGGSEPAPRSGGRRAGRTSGQVYPGQRYRPGGVGEGLPSWTPPSSSAEEPAEEPIEEYTRPEAAPPADLLAQLSRL